MSRECSRIRVSFLALEEGTLWSDEVEEVQAHLGGCEGCRRAWEAWRADDRALRSALAPVEVPRELAGVVVARLRGAQRSQRSRGWPGVVLRWGLAAAAAVLLVAGAVALFSRRYVQVGRVAAIEGRPMARQRGARRPALVEVGSPVYDGDVLVAGKGSRLTLEVDDGSLLDIHPQTEAQLHGGASGAVCARHFRHVCLHDGEVEFDVRSTNRFQGVGTPFGSVYVRGTRFKVAYEAGVRTTLEVMEGEVTFSSERGEVTAGPGSVWAIDGPLSLPRLVRSGP